MDPVELHAEDGPRVARGIVADRCDEASTGQECTDSAVLLTSELVTNAIQHGGGSVSLGVEADGDGVRVEVTDDDDRPPMVKPADPDAESGRGVFLLDALAESWGVDKHDPGKVVWFELPAQP